MISKLEFLTNYIDSISQVHDLVDFDSCLEILLIKLQKTDLQTLEPIILFTLFNNICAQIMVLSNKKIISKASSNLVRYLNQLDFLPPIYRPLLAQLDDQVPVLSPSNIRKYQSPYPQDLYHSIPEIALKSLDFDLAKLLKTEDKTPKYISKNFGYAILDINGDFIWQDEKSENLFEIKKSKLYSTNLFELMIPFSKQILVGRFGPELFSKKDNCAQSIVFSHVIYSRESMKRFLRSIRKLNPKSKRELLSLMNDSTNSIYQKYLKSLSSRATLVLLKYTKSEFKRIIQNRSKDVQMSEHLQHLMQRLTPKKNGNNDENEIEFAAYGIDSFDPRIGVEEESKKPKLIQEPEHSLSSDEDLEFVYRNAILLETRLSYNTPQFDYSKMDDDVIQHFKTKMMNRLKSDSKEIENANT